ncbi:hypothetical protein F4818DRAFT_405257 [Hypoxylon cercidicola]|nr:hypothetical protein F4818DRAFT_405257 [Hypoxylon cercidicola]
MDDLPPPPYTETDLYSHSGRPHSQPGSNDDAATESSSHSTIIYTPPETPRESHHNFGGEDHHTTASAQSYFDTRPTLNRASGQNLVASLAVSESSSPDDFPYPAWARECDTTEQDWHTFINYLLPDHAARANSHIIARKLKAQEDAQSPKSERIAAEAQLDQVRSSSDLPPQSTHNVDAVIREWNDGFFGRRGVTICRQILVPTATSRTPTVEQIPAVDPQPQPQPQEQNGRSRWNPFRSFDVNNRGVRLGGLTIDGDRLSFGNALEVDRNGVRWNGHNLDPSCSGPGPFGGLHQGRGFDEQERGRGRGGRGGRWWKTDPSYHEARDRSPGASSDSSSASSHSASSIGSLPDWDDLKDTQLPVTKQSVAAWLAHPEQPVTKEMLKRVRSDIKAAKNAPRPAHDPAWEANKKALRQEVKAMLARFNELKREQKRARRATRRERRQQGRALRRERRAESKAQSRSTRQYERDLKRLARERRGPPHIIIPPQPTIHIPSPPPVPNIHVPSPPSVPFPVLPHQPTGPLGPFGGPGFFGGGGGPIGNRRAPWEQHVQNAHQQAEQARSRARAEQARAHARAEQARSQAQAEQARSRARVEQVRTRVQAQVDLARAHAASARANAHTQAAAAVAAWTGGIIWPPAPRPVAAVPAIGTGTGTGTGMITEAGKGVLDRKYARAGKLEAQLAHKAEALRELQATVEREGIEAAQRGDGDSKTKGQTQAQRQAEALEVEMEELGREVERLRLEADEELARNLEEEEQGRRR